MRPARPITSEHTPVSRAPPITAFKDLIEAHFREEVKVKRRIHEIETQADKYRAQIDLKIGEIDLLEAQGGSHIEIKIITEEVVAANTRLKEAQDKLILAKSQNSTLTTKRNSLKSNWSNMDLQPSQSELLNLMVREQQ